MAYSFTRFKDHSAGFFNAVLAFVYRCPEGIQKIAYEMVLFLIRALYFLPFSYVRKVSNHFAKLLAGRESLDLYFGLTKGIVRMLRGTQAMNFGVSPQDTPPLNLSVSDEQLLGKFQTNGAIIVLPHATGSLLAVRELASRYDLLMLVKEPKDARRAARQRRFYTKLGCETVDARRTDPVTLARTILKALKAGRFVVGTCDRIRSRPPNGTDYHKYSDTVLIQVLGQEVGAAGWPARFAHKCSLPILPLMPTYEADGVRLHFGAPINAVGNINADSQAWMDALWQLFCQHPEHWLFAYDKKWAKLLGGA